jgi:chromosome segregation ATPase
MQALQGLATAATVAAQLMPSIIFAKGKEMGEISEKINVLGKENITLREKLKTFKKDNAAMNQKIGSQEKTIRALESSQEKLQKELENVKKAKEQLRTEIGQISSENETLTKKWEALTKDFEAVENENNVLKHRLEELTNSNNSLKQTVDSIKQENQELKGEMGNLKAEQKKINEKLECKETRLALGQVAWLLEAEIWKAVLPDEKMGKTGILKSMKRWLKKNSTKSEGEAAQKRWNDLKRTLNWDEDDHNGAMKCLKGLRMEDAHPENVDLEVARKQLIEGNYVADLDKRNCEDIIDMVVTARKLNNSK